MLLTVLYYFIADSNLHDDLYLAVILVSQIGTRHDQDRVMIVGVCFGETWRPFQQGSQLSLLCGVSSRVQYCRLPNSQEFPNGLYLARSVLCHFKYILTNLTFPISFNFYLILW
jgi:hypothetical protein